MLEVPAEALELLSGLDLDLLDKQISWLHRAEDAAACLDEDDGLALVRLLVSDRPLAAEVLAGLNNWLSPLHAAMAEANGRVSQDD